MNVTGSMFAYFHYLVFRSFSFLVNLLSEPQALALGRFLGRTAFHLDREHRQVALENLETAFGETRSKTEQRNIALKTFQNLGMTAVEFLRIPRINPEALKEKVTFEGLEHLNALMEKRGGGFFFLLAHVGNWELMSLAVKFLRLKASVIARPIKKNRWVDRMVTGIRQTAGLEVLSKERASRQVFRALSQKRIVGILIDQRAKRSEGVWVDFFGKKAPTTPALAVLAMRTGAPVVPVFLVREGYDRYRMMFLQPLDLVSTGDVKADVEINTQRMNHVVESVIRQYPDQWFWVHRRWERKKRPRTK